MGTEVINLGGVERELARLGNKVDALGSHVSSVESQIPRSGMTSLLYAMTF